MGFSNPITGSSGALVRQAIKSPNYVAGTSGWSVRKDGTAEFASVTASTLGGKLADLLASNAATVATSETTTSTTYTDLTTPGPSVAITLVAARRLKVTVCAQAFQVSTTNAVYTTYAASGATTVAAADAQAAIQNGTGNAESVVQVSYVDAAAGTTTFTAKYRAAGGTGQFASRTIVVEVLR